MDATSHGVAGAHDVERHGAADLFAVQEEIAEAIAEKIGPITPLPPEDPESGLAAFTVAGQAQAVWGMIESEAGGDGATGQWTALRQADSD